MIAFTERAARVLERADAGARRLNPDACVRLSARGTALEAALVEAPEDGDETVRVGGASIYVAAGIDGLVDAEDPHDRLVLRPAD